MGRNRLDDKVARDSSGTFVKNLGWKDDKRKPGEFKQHRFYLGKDGAEAVIRGLRLEQVWAAVQKRWQKHRRGERPIWDEITLQIGMSVAHGEQVCKLDIIPDEVPSPDGVGEIDSSDAPALVLWLRELQDDFPMIRLALADDEMERDGSEYWEAEATKLIEHGTKLLKRNTRQTLHQALDAFAEAQRARYTGHDQKLSQTGQVAVKDVQRIKEHAKDVPLGDFDGDAIDAIVDYWAKRPPVKTHARFGQPAAVKTVKNTLKRFRMFIRWLHKAKSFDWRKPDDYEVTPVKIRVTPEELAARVNSDQVATYTVEQLVTLWQYAKPRERLWMLLALNCGFGIAELATLQRSEIHQNQKHKKFGIVGNFIQRIRTKNHVYAEWQLWDQTVAAIDWYLTQRPRTDVQNLIVDGKGKAISDQTSGGNRAQEIPNAWAALTRRIRADHPDFPKLSFNKLRKTAQDNIRDIAGGEVCGIFAAHGKAVPSDELLDVYTNRPWDKVFAACRQWGEKLAAMFGSVAEPFKEAKRKHRKSDKFKAELAQVVQLRGEGKTYKAISEASGLKIRMVRHYLDTAKNQPPVKAS